MQQLSKILTGAALAAILAGGGPASANVTFSDSNTGGIGETNILFDLNDTSNPLLGQIDHSGVDVSFTSLTSQTLLGGPNGQADIQNAANPGTAVLTSIEMTAAPGTAWGDVIINLDESGGLPTGCTTATPCTAHIVAIDNFNNHFTDDVLEHGSNFTTAIADTVGNPSMGIPAEFITQIQVTELAGENNPSFGWTDFKQPRVSGLCTLVPGTNSCTLIPTPEPTSLVLLGTGVLGLGLLARRRRN